MNDMQSKIDIQTKIVPNVPMWIYTHKELCGAGKPYRYSISFIDELDRLWGSKTVWISIVTARENGEDEELGIESITLPKGWRVSREGHIFDEHDTHRANFMPDEVAGTFDFYIMPRYMVKATPVDGMYRVSAIDRVGMRETVFVNYPFDFTNEQLTKAKEEFMQKYYPDYLDPLAYWDQP